MNYDAIPSIIYTHPEVAWVGKTEEEVKEAVVGISTSALSIRRELQSENERRQREGMVKFISLKIRTKFSARTSSVHEAVNY